MRKGSKKAQDLTLYDLLTADVYDEKIKIKDNSHSESYSLIENRRVFFGENGLFVPPENNKLIEKNGDNKQIIDLDSLLNEIQSSEYSSVVLIEGFAGCGKSTLAQYILSKQLRTFYYDYELYNYNLEAKCDIGYLNEKGILVKKSSILFAITNYFVEELNKQTQNNKQVFFDFCDLLSYCKDFPSLMPLYSYFLNTDTLKSVCEDVNNNNYENFSKRILAQINTINSTICVLALDYILRLSMYKNRIIEQLYICYDNLDAIEDADDLINFDSIIVDFTRTIDGFIDEIYSKELFNDLPTPHFIILATYRKITANIAELSKIYKEVALDQYEDIYHRNRIKYIDATSVFSYKKIVQKRMDYFNIHLSGVFGLSVDKIEQLIKFLKSWNTLNNNLVIMNERYSGLWNKNYRTCSLIANELFSEEEYKFTDCVDFIDNDSSPDGYEETHDETGENLLCSYYGGSAILLSNVCKVFNNKQIWDHLLDLSDLTLTHHSYQSVSLARLVLTYMYNNDNIPVSLEELYHTFCEKAIFSVDKLCDILSKMLARNQNGFWRRPIYYANTCILAEDALSIKNELMKECTIIEKYNRTEKNYTFLLCISGQSFVERLMSEFEFFSNRLSNDNSALYLNNDINIISRTIKNVYNAVSSCCTNVLLFRKEYMERYNITSYDYLQLLFHPRTNRKSSQLNIERTIFSHISYLNNVRLYYLDKRVTHDIEKRKQYNTIFVKYIDMYLNLFADKIMPICRNRKTIYRRLKRKTNIITNEINNDTPNLDILFSSISL